MLKQETTIRKTNIKIVTVIDTTSLQVTWEAIPAAVKYNIYASTNPINMNLIDTITTNMYLFKPIISLPEDVTWYFWVSWIDSGNSEYFIDTEETSLWDFNPFNPSPLSKGTEDFYINNEMMEFYFEEIRRRSKAMLENDGEDFYVYYRRWLGPPCHCVTKVNGTMDNSDPYFVNAKNELINQQTSDPDYQGSTRCPDCFGTGIYGGYYPKIRLKARYGNLPQRTIRFMKQGIDFSHDFDSWTLYAPKLHEHDILLRISTGDRLDIVNIGESSWRGLPMHQEMKTFCFPETDIVYSVTDAKINAALGLAPGYTWNALG